MNVGGIILTRRKINLIISPSASTSGYPTAELWGTPAELEKGKWRVKSRELRV
jgi:hypothetical protein